MYSFLVLGLIPGTDVQITFLAWLIGLAILGGVVLLASRVLPRRGPLLTMPQRRPLPASQLHLRVL